MLAGSFTGSSLCNPHGRGSKFVCRSAGSCIIESCDAQAALWSVGLALVARLPLHALSFDVEPVVNRQHAVPCNNADAR